MLGTLAHHPALTIAYHTFNGHVLFGTDMPLGGPTVVADTIADISSLGLPEADEAAIFAGNAARLLGVAA